MAQHGAPVSAGRGQLGVKARVRRAAAQPGASWSAPPRRQARAKRVTAHRSGHGSAPGERSSWWPGSAWNTLATPS